MADGVHINGPDSPGSTVEDFGEYRQLRRIAAGGMAEIYTARQKGNDELIVLKRLLPQFADNSNLVNRFLDEGRLVAGLDHPNIIDVYNVGSVGDHHFLSMEYLRGVDLRRVCVSLFRNKRRLPMPIALKIIENVADALQYAHEKRSRDGKELGIVHRDVTPHNILALFDGRVKLVDFGVAKVADSIHKTRTGALIGKVSYMSPEQCSGSAVVNSKSDVFSLAIVMYELTTVRRLYNIKLLGDLEVLRMICERDPAPPSSLVDDYPKEVEKVLFAAMNRDIDKRLSAKEFADQIREVAAKLDMQATQEEVADFLAGEFPDLAKAAETSFREVQENTPTNEVVRSPPAQLTPMGSSATPESAFVYPVRDKSKTGTRESRTGTRDTRTSASNVVKWTRAPLKTDTSGSRISPPLKKSSNVALLIAVAVLVLVLLNVVFWLFLK